MARRPSADRRETAPTERVAALAGIVPAHPAHPARVARLVARLPALVALVSLLGCAAAPAAELAPATIGAPAVGSAASIDAPAGAAAPPSDAEAADPPAPRAEPSPAPSVAAQATTLPPPVPTWVLAPGWDRGSLASFEADLERWFPSGSPRRIDPEGRTELSRALDRNDDVAVRAALLLARSLDPAAGEELLARLERRIERAEDQGAGDAPDVVAAAAFARGAAAANAARRLEGLARGSRPHPDLEVRVECAASALALGRDAVVPFLARVLREGTAAAKDPPDWKRGSEVGWAQARAADALARRAGVATDYLPEASAAAREAEAARLEGLLAPKKKAKK